MSNTVSRSAAMAACSFLIGALAEANPPEAASTGTAGLEPGRAGIAEARAVEIGTNDFRISVMGPPGAGSVIVRRPAVAHNSARKEFLVVWQSSSGINQPLIATETEIWGQRIDAQSGERVGETSFRISFAGPDGTNAFRPDHPSIAYNSAADEYLVVWESDDDRPGMADNDFEILGQRLGGTGALIGETNFRISHTGPDGDVDFRASAPNVVYNPAHNEYLVVWHANVIHDGSNPRLEVYGQRLDAATGAKIGVPGFLIGSLGPEGDADFDARFPDVVYNPVDDEYLVLWQGNDGVAPLDEAEFEIYAQRLDGSGAEIGADDFRISFQGPEGDPAFGAAEPAVTHNRVSNEYLAVWFGDETTGDRVDNEMEIYGQRLGADGTAQGGNFQISRMGPDGDLSFFAFSPDVIHDPVQDEYLVAWSGTDDRGVLLSDEFEIYGQLLDGADAAEIGEDDVRISDMGVDGDASFGAAFPALAQDGTGRILAAWNGDEVIGEEREQEVYGQMLQGSASQPTATPTGTAEPPEVGVSQSRLPLPLVLLVLGCLGLLAHRPRPDFRPAA